MAPAFAARALRQTLGYPKFCNERKRVVVFDSQYHVQAQLCDTLKRMGHHVLVLPAGGPNGPRHCGDACAQLCRAMLAHRPDFLLSINHIGFDFSGAIGHLVDACRMPLAVWYVDCPFLSHDGHLVAAPDMSTLFVWERTMMPVLRKCGAERVHYLPLGCDTAAFRPHGDPATQNDLTFVGNSMAVPVTRWQDRLTPQEVAQAKEMAQALTAAPRSFHRVLGTPAPTPDRRMTVLALATYEATARHRAGLLQHVAPTLDLVGDDGWRTWLPQAKGCAPMIPYGPALARVYQSSAVNLNITSLQMPTAVNQRVFDCPASGGFLLADAQEDMFELLGEDAVATFDDASSLKTRTAYFLRHETQRQALVAKARERTLAEHTYEHRLNAMMAVMARDHGSRLRHPH